MLNSDSATVPLPEPSRRSELAKSETTYNKGKANMKTTIYLPMAAMLLTAALAVSAAAQNQVPFKGSLQGQEIDIPQGGPPPTTLSVNGRATGIATHVGQFSFTYQLTVTLANGTATGSAHLIAVMGTVSIRQLPDRVYRRHPVSVALRKLTPLRVVRVDSPEPKGVSLSSA